MAVTLSFSSCSTYSEFIYFQMGTPPCHRIVLVHASSSNISINNLTSSSSPLCIGPANSNIKLKVFKDPWTGIVCYKDEKGERNCEGYDEGPHFCQQFPVFSNSWRVSNGLIIRPTLERDKCVDSRLIL